PIIQRIGRVGALLLLCSPALRAQPPKPPAPTSNPLTVQTVESSKGYMARIPAEAMLDSSASGWSPKGLYEKRVYRIPKAGIIQIIVTVKPQAIPLNALKDGGYTYTLSDSATSQGTAFIKTYYLPTRTVRMEVIPTGIAMRKYIEGRDDIFKSFRWKPGAATDVIDTDPPPPDPNQKYQLYDSDGNKVN
ncbi:MAG: hypothetical protein ABIR47_16840, partial [Candidatus Kapaibacterium sp.]